MAWNMSSVLDASFDSTEDAASQNKHNVSAYYIVNKTCQSIQIISALRYYGDDTFETLAVRTRYQGNGTPQ